MTYYCCILAEVSRILICLFYILCPFRNSYFWMKEKLSLPIESEMKHMVLHLIMSVLLGTRLLNFLNNTVVSTLIHVLSFVSFIMLLWCFRKAMRMFYQMLLSKYHLYVSRILRNISFVFFFGYKFVVFYSQGELLMIVGPVGCGKVKSSELTSFCVDVNLCLINTSMKLREYSITKHYVLPSK